MVLASASTYFFDANRHGADRIDVAGVLALNEGNLVFTPAPGSPARHGQKFTIATADLGVDGEFGDIFSLSLLRPKVTYKPNSVEVELRAGSIFQFLSQLGRVEAAFAQALDLLRANHYNDLYSLYGAIDLMDPTTLSNTLQGLSPTIASETHSLQDRQSQLMLNSITDRLSTLGTGPTGMLSVNGSPAMAAALSGGAPASLPFAGVVPSGRVSGGLPQGVTGFANSGYVSGGSATGANRLGARGGRHIAYGNMGLEIEAAENFTLGTAFGYAYGFSAPGLERSEARTTQVAAYGSYRLGRGIYVAGLAVAEISRTDMERNVATGDLAFDLHGATESSRYGAMVEAGTNLDLVRGLTLTPRVALAYSRYHLGGFEERGGEAALRLGDLRLQRLETRAGARLAGHVQLGRWALRPQIQADVVHTLSGAQDALSVSFADVPDFAFALPFANGDTSWGEVRGGFTLDNGRFGFGAGVETAIGRSGFRDDRAVADFTVRF
jgi:uncharacterized protein with beta-barrel porin domain